MKPTPQVATLSNPDTRLISPVTYSGNVSLERKLSSQRIMDKWWNDLKIDVSRFYEGLDEISIYRCEDTGYRFYHPFTLTGDDQVYKDLQAKAWYYPEWKWENEIILNELPENSHILEVGCGEGHFLERLSEKRITGIGLELNDKAVEVGHQNNLDIRNELVGEHAVKHPGSYDAVMSFQVLEHVCEVKEFIEDSLEALKPGGRLIFGVPNSNPFLHKYDLYHTLNLPPHHMGLWSRQAFEHLPSFFDMDVEKIIVENLAYPTDYARVHIRHYIGENRIGNLLNRVSRRVAPLLLNPLKKFIEGRNIVAIYRKRS